MKDKVVLIQPKNTLALNIYPPLNLIKIGSAVQAKGYEVKVIACPTTKESMRIILDECRDALFAGMGILTSEVPHALEIAKGIRENFNVPLIWGGWHATLFPQQLAESDLVDKVIVDEGDELIVKAAQFYRDDGHRKDGEDKILRNEGKLDLDLLPEPDYSLVPNLEFYINARLADKFLEYDNRVVRWLPYEASRGCPSDCTFCINVVTDNRRHRRKAPQRIAHEIESLVKRHNINHLKIVDDNFFVNVGWVKEIASLLIQKNLGITWDAECRVDYFNDRHVNEECLELCTKAGLNELNFGIESGSQASLDIMRKGITPEQSLHALSVASRHGIVLRCSFVIDLPGETREDIYKTVDLIKKIREIPKTTCGVHTFRPYPRSELCEKLLRDNVIKQPQSLEGWGDKRIVEQFILPEAKRRWQKNYKISNLISFYQCLESGFWLRPHQINNRIISAINSLFIKLARLRNRISFYRFVIDRYLYLLFKNLYYRCKEWRG